MAGRTVSRTAHFVLHRRVPDAPPDPIPVVAPSAVEGRHHPGATRPRSPGPQALFLAGGVWIGALIPKRWAKRAVTRNAIKRQIYTVSQAFETTLPAAAHVVRLRATFDRARFVSATSDALKQEVRGELQELFARAAP